MNQSPCRMNQNPGAPNLMDPSQPDSTTLVGAPEGAKTASDQADPKRARDLAQLGDVAAQQLPAGQGGGHRGRGQLDLQPGLERDLLLVPERADEVRPVAHRRETSLLQPLQQGRDAGGSVVLDG